MTCSWIQGGSSLWCRSSNATTAFRGAEEITRAIVLEDSLHLLHGRWVAVTAAFRGAQGDELEMYYDAVLKKWVDPSDPDSMKPDEPLGLPPAAAAASPAPAAAAAARCCWGGTPQPKR